MAEESYVEKIFRLTFKRDATVLYKRSNYQGRILHLIGLVLTTFKNGTVELSTFERMRINLADVAPVLTELTRIAGGLRQNKVFNDRLNELDQLNPRDRIVENVE